MKVVFKKVFGLSEQDCWFEVIKSETRPASHGWCCWLPWLPGSLRAQLHFTGRSAGTVTPAASVATLMAAHPSRRANVKSLERAEMGRQIVSNMGIIWLWLLWLCLIRVLSLLLRRAKKTLTCQGLWLWRWFEKASKAEPSLYFNVWFSAPRDAHICQCALLCPTKRRSACISCLPFHFVSCVSLSYNILFSAIIWRVIYIGSL